MSNRVRDDVAAFLGGKQGDRFDLMTIYSALVNYVLDHKLIVLGPDRIIEPDERLRSLLGPAKYPLRLHGDWNEPRYSLINLEMYIKDMIIGGEKMTPHDADADAADVGPGNGISCAETCAP